MVEKLQEKIEKVKEAVKRCGLDSECVGCPYENQHCSELDRDIITVIDCLEAKVPRWISVKESLPDENGKYLVHAHHWLEGIEPIIKCSFWHSGKWDKCDAYIVDHWMPLPEAPKGGAE